MVQFLSKNFFLGFLQFLLGFSKVPVFFVSLCIKNIYRILELAVTVLLNCNHVINIYVTIARRLKYEHDIHKCYALITLKYTRNI